VAPREPLTTSYWPADTSRPVIDRTFGDALRHAVEVAGDTVALVEVAPEGSTSMTGAAATGRRWTYAELLDEAQRCAAWLLGSYEPGSRICMWAPNVPEWVVLDYGAALAGMVVVTANPALGVDELRYILEQSRSSLLIHADRFRGVDMTGVAQMAAVGGCDLFALPGWETTVRAHPAAPAELPTVRPGDPVQIQYTSGTTGRPKGALLHHRGLLNNAWLLADRMGLSAGVTVSGLPLFHTSGTAMNVLAPVTTYSTAVVPTVFEPGLVLDAIEDLRCDALGAVPTMLLALLEHPSLPGRDLSSLRVAITGGAPMPPILLERVERDLGCDLVTLYGQTELSPAISVTTPDDSPEDKAHTAGTPLARVEVKIADSGTGEVLPVGVEGEICARGHQVMLGYFDMPERTAEAVDGEGWLHTGDLGTMDDRGYLRITGRLTDMIIRGGENLYPAEIEEVLAGHSGVAEVAVFGLPDPHWGEVVAAAVRTTGPAAQPSSAAASSEAPAVPSPEALEAFCRDRLASHKVPRRWFRCESFPLTGSGKIQKFRLREMEAAGELAPLADPLTDPEGTS
jgi:fatty-acyl-CoA synthase/long-chain acyl-CoA synthetase